MVYWCDFWGYKNRKIGRKKTQKENKKAKQNTSKASDDKSYKYELFTKTSVCHMIYMYIIMVQTYQYHIYVYIDIVLYPLKYIKAAAIGQSEELFCPILNCLNILQPYSEDTEIKLKEREKRK